MTDISSSEDEPIIKRRRLTPLPSSAAPPATFLAAEPPALALPTEEVEEEPWAAPPSTAAGAHAKPLSAMFSTVSTGVGASRKNANGKGKGKELEGFEETLARLQEGSSLISFYSLLSFFWIFGFRFCLECSTRRVGNGFMRRE